MTIKILCIGDVVGRPGRKVLEEHLGGFISARSIDLVVCNAENAAGGSGITKPIFDKLLSIGVDVITLGDHCYRKKEVIPILEQSDRIVRPANMSKTAAGKKWTVVETKSGGHKVAVACLLGQLYIGQYDSPFEAVENILKEIPQEVKVRIIDFHAEATSEKIALGWKLSGRVSAVFGTHTHVPTADAKIIDGKTAYITDVGMTGPYDSVLGRRKDRVLKYLITDMPQHFEIAMGDPRMAGVLIEVDPTTGNAKSIERIEISGEIPDGGPYDHDDGIKRNHGKK